MSRSIGTTLPATLTRLLDGHDLAEREGFTILLITTGDDGLVHVALLSVGEVVAMQPGIRLALWPGSASAEHMGDVGRGLLYMVADGAGFAVDIRTIAARPLALPRLRAAAFGCVVVDVREDRVGYAELLSGPTFRLVDRARHVHRWERAIDALRRIELT
jgi:hypothetical protein